ncbi:hypothetical protein E4T56_gene9798 [Termitomyces sp. T112]|nr:hypothetical protein E4T56_gene9798 [Termitomyces sp. T112]
MQAALQRTTRDASVAESSAMALSNNNADHAAQADSHISNDVAPSLGLFNDYLLDFQTTAQSLTSTLYGELEAIFSRINIHDISSSHFDKPSKTACRPTSKSHHPTYIEPAYHWLLENIHNPYPPKEVRVNIARKAKSDVKSVEAWFVDARSRIGWNTLRKTHFGNRRADIVDAATRFFVQFDQKRPLGTTLEFEFAQMENSAKNLYAGKFGETMLAAKLDVVVKDLTPEMKIQAKMRAREEELERQKAASSYPSPLHSPDRSPEPAGFPSLVQETELLSTPPDTLTRRKRRSLSPEGDDSASSSRAAKRARAESPPPAATGLPSPTPSSHESLRRSVSPLPSSSDFIPLPTMSRKRRLSESDGQGAPKRPRGAPAASRLHVVSDPLPMPPSTSFDSEVSDLDNWFNAQLDALGSVSVDPLYDSQGLDLAFYTYSNPELAIPSTSSEPLAGTFPASQSVDVVPSVLIDDGLSNGLDIPTNSFDYNELFDDYEQPPFGHQEFRYEVPDGLPASHPPLAEFPFLTNLPAVSSYNDPHSTANISEPTMTNSNSNIDWNFPSFEQLAGPFGDLDLLQILNRNDSLQTLSTTASFLGIAPAPRRPEEVKAELRCRLAAMKEEMQRLEERIAEDWSEFLSKWLSLQLKGFQISNKTQCLYTIRSFFS